MHGKTSSYASAAATSSKRSREHVDIDCPGESGSRHGSGRSIKKMKIEHKPVNTSKKPYSCHACSKAFASSSALTVHLRVHSGDKPYSCDTCGKAFAESGTLTRHLRVHSGDKPYSCDTCGKAFSGSSGLQKHMCFHR